MRVTRFCLIFILLLLIVPRFSFSQYVDFGRNKVQYNNFDWYTLSTEHFKIYYYKEMKELAQIGAAYAEDWYKIHQQDFNYNLIDTVPIIFYSSPTHFRETNTTPGLIPDGVGGFFEFIKGRVVIPYDGSLGNFKHVIGHELTHVFMMAKIYNVLKAHRKTTEQQPPLWFTEGLAELWSTEWDATGEMIIKDAVLNNYMVGLNDWEYFYGTFFMYKMGQTVLEYISETYGKEKVLLIIENFWMSEDFSVVLQKTIGKDYDAFDKEWLYFLKKKYFPQLAEQDNPSAKSLPVFTGGFAHKPTYYTDGINEDVYCIGNITGYTSIFKVNLKEPKSSPELIIEGDKYDRYESFHYFRSGLDVSNKGILAFSTKSGEADILNLYDTKQQKIITDYSFKGIVEIGSPSFSHDGNQIVFSGQEMSGKVDLYIIDLLTKNLIRLTNDYFDDRDADFSPDGKTIIFSSDRTAKGDKNKYNLFLYTLKDNSIRYITYGEQIDYSPHFSSDGKKIIYTSTKGGNQNIWCLELNDDLNTVKESQTKKLTNFTTSTFDPRWVDSNRVVFSAYENGGITVKMLDSVSNLINKPIAVDTINYADVQKVWAPNKFIGVSAKNDLKYNKEYSLDIATTSVGIDPVFGTNAGGVVALSDLLGNDQYYFLLYNNSESGDNFFKNINIAVTRVSLQHRLNYAYGIFGLSGKRYDFGDDFSYYERSFGGYFAVSYPLSAFRRIEAGISLANSKRDLTQNAINRRSLQLTNSISYVKDNSIWGPTGPLDGNRLNITLSYTNDVQFSNVNYFTAIFDYRRYFRISRTVALAQRLEFLINEGREARRWAIGGSWDLRGYSRFSLRGKKVWVSSTELRFPLIDIFAVHFPFGINFDFPYIRGAAFFDAGNAWDKEYGETKGSIGLGARMNVFGFIALRYDIGKRIENNFKKLQSGIFQQFFFGWDF